MSKKSLIGKRTIKQNRKYYGVGLFGLSLFVFVLMILRFSYIGLFKNISDVNLIQKAQNLYTQTSVIKAKRGTIYDANDQPIAEDTSTYSIYAVLDKNQKSVNGKPIYVDNKKKVARSLSKILPISYKRVLKDLNPSNKNTFQVEFGSAGQNISLTTKQKIDDQHLRGINFIQQQSRLYPNGIFASHLIGIASPFTDNKTDSTSLVGQMGIEKAFNNYLTGTDGIKKVQNDVYGYQLPNGVKKDKPVKNGDNIYTTLDYRLQTLLETEMSSVYAQVHPSSMNAVLMNAKTGEILAATQRPTFNATNKEGIGSIWRDTLVEDQFEPGSTMKIFTMAAAINSHHYDGNAYYQSGKYDIDGNIVPDWNPSGWGTITYNKGFALSSNVAMAHLEQNMGASTWMDYIKRFQFLKSVNTGLDGEQSGSVQFKYPIEQANTAFGQGIQVTSMQIMRALSAVSNDGKMLQPRFITKIVNPNNNKVVKSYPKKVVGTPITAKTAKEVRQHMEDVVYKPYGIGADYKIPGYRIAAKTGTAQVSNGNGGYSSGDNSYLYSVAGMAPASDPKYVMYITMKQPNLTNSKLTASQYLAEIFKPVLKRALSEDKIGKTTNTVKMPTLIGSSVSAANRKLAAAGVSATIVGSGNTITKQSVVGGEKIFKNRKLILITNGAQRMINLKGWSESDVSVYCQLVGLKLRTSGEGVVKDQSIATGASIESNKTLVIKFNKN
ncbi:penicillin-binding protein [Nicoliella spurrieriana]|uniref:Penicillin-binding protein n=1 Tax=Nicoliella spurrieriana TaxID=2925830 RepID=A0A976X5C8_9LACO|nr:penicillin-binding protein [Nicoliella spurrieriana]UQS86432.1 penicillin-binding protein [Nicoliella spurrieriana]